MKPRYKVHYWTPEGNLEETNLGVFDSPDEARNASVNWAEGYNRTHEGGPVRTAVLAYPLPPRPVHPGEFATVEQIAAHYGELREWRELHGLEVLFFATFGSGQPGYPGYLQVIAKADPINGGLEVARGNARAAVHERTEGRWCALYDSLEKLHPGDKHFRGCVSAPVGLHQ